MMPRSIVNYAYTNSSVQPEFTIPITLWLLKKTSQEERHYHMTVIGEKSRLWSPGLKFSFKELLIPYNQFQSFPVGPHTSVSSLQSGSINVADSSSFSSSCLMTMRNEAHGPKGAGKAGEIFIKKKKKDERETSQLMGEGPKGVASGGPCLEVICALRKESRPDFIYQ